MSASRSREDQGWVERTDTMRTAGSVDALNLKAGKVSL